MGGGKLEKADICLHVLSGTVFKSKSESGEIFLSKCGNVIDVYPHRCTLCIASLDL